MLGGLFFLFCGANAIQTFFTLFAAEILHRDTAQATFLLLIFALCSMAAALPAGWLGRKVGRKKTILIGLVLFLGAFVLFFFVFLALGGSTGLSIGEFVRLNTLDPGSEAVGRTVGFLSKMIFPVLMVAGVANMMITVNTLPLVLEKALCGFLLVLADSPLQLSRDEALAISAVLRHLALKLQRNLAEYALMPEELTGRAHEGTKCAEPL